MEKLFKDLAFKCYENDLHFSYWANFGLIEVYTFISKEVEWISRGYIKDWEDEAPEEVLKRIHLEVDEYLETKNNSRPPTRVIN